jgi:hypothetical protein
VENDPWVQVLGRIKAKLSIKDLSVLGAHHQKTAEAIKIEGLPISRLRVCYTSDVGREDSETTRAISPVFSANTKIFSPTPFDDKDEEANAACVCGER